MVYTAFKISRIHEIKKLITQEFRERPFRIICSFLIAIFSVDFILNLLQRNVLHLYGALKLIVVFLSILGLFTKIRLEDLLKKSITLRILKKIKLFAQSK